MPHNLTHITAAIRATGRTTTHGAILLAEVDRLRRIVDTVIPAAGCFDPDNDDQVDALAMAWCERFHAMKQEVDRLRALVDDLRRDCSELYQVVGAMAYAPRQFDDQQITKALDNAWAAAQGEPRPHDDLLPFALRASQDERRRAPAPELFTHQPAGMTGYTFRIAWSTDDGEWVGTCDQLPSLSYLHHDPVEAAEWICSLVADYVDELDAKLNPLAPSSGCPNNGPHDFAPTDPCPVCGDRIAIVPLGKPVPESRCVAPVREEG